MRSVGTGTLRSGFTRWGAAALAVATILAVDLIPSVASAELTGESFASVVAGSTNSCALTTSATLYCWGANNYHQLLDGTTTADDSPEALSLTAALGSSTITSYATGNGTTCVLSSASTVYCWGYGGQGQVGDDHFATSLMPVEVDFSGVHSGTISELVGGGTNSFCVLTTSSQIWCWGDNLNGQLGDGTNSNADVATQVTDSGVLSARTISKISGWSQTFCAIDSVGRAYCWGYGQDGALGNSSFTDSNVPVAVDTGVLPTGTTVKQIAPSDTHTCLLDSSSNVWCWGSNDAGVNGLGDPDGTTNPNSWIDVPQKVTALDGLGVDSIKSSSTESCALTSGGALYCWGAAPLGDGYQTGSQLVPELISKGDIFDRTLSDVSIATYTTCAVDSQASVYCWGENSSGEVGDETTMTSVSSELIAVSPTATPVVTTPNTPVGVGAISGNQNIVVSWLPPYSDGGSSVTGYIATASIGNDTFTCTGGPTDTGCTITGLTNGTTYDVYVVATNAHGNSLADNVGPVALATVPDAPVLTSVPVSDGEIIVNWTPGASDGGLAVSSFTATATAGAASQSCSGGPLATTCTITDVTNSTPYTVSVVATNSDGDSAASNSLIATPGGVASVPQNVGAVAGEGSVAVSWTAPSSNGGTPLTGFVATATNGATNISCDAGPADTGCTIEALTNGTAYIISAVAVNEAGNSSSVSVGSFTPTSTPDAPTLVHATGANEQIVVTWAPGSSNGGLTVTSFTATATLGLATPNCSGGEGTTTCTITGLTNGANYAVTVIATNSLGPSINSNIIEATPATAPSSPVLHTITAESGAVNVSWTAPTNNGGAAISKYTVTATPGGATCIATSTNCTVTHLIATTGYTFKVVATNAVSSSPPVTSAVVYPFGPKTLSEEMVKPVVATGQVFLVIVGGGTVGAKVTVASTNSPAVSCTVNAERQCVVTFKQKAIGLFRVTAKSGAAGFALNYDVAETVTPATGVLKKAVTIRFYYCPAGTTIQLSVSGGKTYATKASAAGVGSLNIVWTKTGTYTLTTVVDGVTMVQTKKIRIT